MTTTQLAGVYAAAVTPLTGDGKPDLEALPAFLSFLAGRGCHGALLLGTTGEGPSFSAQERGNIWRAALRVREAHPNFRLLAGTGTPSLTETSALTRLAFDLGMDGVVCLPPFYFRNATDDGLFDWFSRLIRASVPGDGALLGYHFPAVAGIGFSLDLLARLKSAYPVQFAGLKDSSHDAELASALGKRFGRDLQVFTGTDSFVDLALSNSAAGCITAAANLISPELRKLYDAFQDGRARSAIQSRVSALRHVLEQYPPFPPCIKTLLHRIHKMPMWQVRAPLCGLASEIADRAAAEFLAV